MNFHHLFIFSVFSLSSISLFGAENDNSLIRHDGVYKYTPEISEDNKEDPNTPLCSYLRFYPDGTVITANTKCNAKPLTAGELSKFKKWFRKGRKNIGRSNFKVRERTIYFSITYGNETFDYSGEVIDSTIHLTLSSDVIPNQIVNSYLFIKW
jgi:hypothetical protein